MAMTQRPLSLVKGRGTRAQGRIKAGQTDAPLPTNPEAEKVTIGATLDYDPAAEIIPLLEPDDFATTAHQILWDVIRYDLHAKGRPVTVAGVNDALAARGQLSEVGGQLYVLELQTRGAYAVHVRDYAKMVFDRARERALIRMSGELAGYAYNSLEIEAALLSHQAQLVEWDQRAKLFTNEGALVPGLLASNVERRRVEWLWRGRLAYGKLSIIDADPGMGKGLLGIDLVARLTTGRAMPDEDQRAEHEPCAVVLVTPEDEPDDTIVPRLEAAGADLSRVVIFNSVPIDGEGAERPVTFPRDIPLLEQIIETHDARFLIIDPIMACLDAEVKTANDQEVRAALQPLKQLVARRHVAALMMRHMNKSGGDKALYRGGGSIAFTGLARVAMLLAEHPDDDSLVALAVVKTNISSKKLPTLSFQIVAEFEDATPHITWQREEVQYSADALLGAKRSDERRDYIAVFQQNGGEMTPHDVALALGVPPEQEGKVRVMLRKMVKAGELRQPKYGYYAL